MPHYSLEQIGRILGVELRRLRYWQRIGLLPRQPDGFDWNDLSRARTLARLVADGVPARGLLPFSPILETRQVHGENRKLVVRDGGQFREAASGQWVLDFESTANDNIRVLPLTQEWVDLAHQAFDEGQPKEAVQWAGQALNAGGASVETLNDLGLLFLTTGDHERAVQVLLEAVDLPDAGARQWFNLSHALEANGREEESKAALQRSLDLDPHFADARFNLALTYERLGETGKAYSQWREFLKRHADVEEAETVKFYLEKVYADGRVIPLRTTREPHP